MSGHTPGPWAAEYTAGEWIIRAQGRTGLASYIGGLPVGGMDGRKNALLFAAAPELLSALTRLSGLAREIVPALSATGVNVSLTSDVAEAAQIARAAIAKATGDQP